jgi:uncharacterized membrane protein (DUF485 family)
MKKFKIIICIIGGFCLGVLAAVAVYFCTVGEVAWQEYLETKLVPNAVIVLTSIGTILVAATPLISKIQSTLTRFDKATKDVNDTVETGKSTKNSLELQDEKITAFANRFDKLEEILSGLENNTQDIEQIVQLGFCNMDELVKKGYAVEIEKVAQDEHEKIED